MGEIAGGVTRALLAALGGLVTGQGWVDGDTWRQVSGSLTTLIVIAWSIWAKVKAAR